MSAPRARAGPHRRTVVRRRLTAFALLALVVAAAGVVVVGSGLGSPGSSQGPAVVRLRLDGRTVARGAANVLERPRAAAALLGSVPARRIVHRGAGTFRLEVERAETERAVMLAARNGGGTVSVRERPLAVSIKVPLVKQALPNDCEAASLAMLLAFRGKPVGQLELQRQVAHSQPLDPIFAADGSEVWGDPDKGFVGRADGGGPAGGFGVYQGPIEALAKHEGVALRDLSGKSPAAVYGALMHGRPVMAWVALSAGPYASWRTPAGRTVHIDWGEHAVVLTGVGPAGVRVNDPLSGTRLTWSKEQFEQMWRELGSRALAA